LDGRRNGQFERLLSIQVATDFFALGGYTDLTNGGGYGMRVYVDAVMGLNFLVDLLLLVSTNRLAGIRPRQNGSYRRLCWEGFTVERVWFPDSGFWAVVCGG
jgi:hypothetical protein